jgi:hypothetical protein
LERENCQLNTQAIGEGESKRPCWGKRTGHKIKNIYIIFLKYFKT